MRIPVSAKTGIGVAEVLEAIVHRLPPPTGDPNAPPAGPGLRLVVRCLSWRHRAGARHAGGTLRKNQRIRFMSNGKVFDVESMGVLMPKPVEIAELRAGEVGFFAATIKNVGDTKIGDTVTEEARQAAAQLPASKNLSRWSSPASTRSIRTSTHAAARRT